MDSLRTDAEDIIQAIPSGLFIYRFEAPDALYLLSGNPEARRLTGLDPQDWKGREFKEIWPTATEAGITDKYLEVMRTGKVFEAEDLHYEDQRLSGAFRIRAFALPEQRLAVAFENITERKKAEQSLKESQELLSLFISRSPIFAYIKQCTQTESRVLHASENYIQMIGIRGSQMVGKTMFELFPPEFAAKITADDWAVVSKGKVLHLEEELGGRSYDTIKFPITQGGQTMLAGYTIDRTERKEAEAKRLALEAQLQQAMKMEAVGRLAGGVAHDFNNLLTGIVGNAELALLLHHPSEPLAEALKEILKAAGSATELTRQLLAFSRKQPIVPRLVNLNDLVDSVQKMLIRVIGEDIRLVTTLEPDLWAVMVDPGQFEQILANLAVNARDAMPDGGQLTLTTANLPAGSPACSGRAGAITGDQVLLAVRDTGHGMTSEVKARLFEPFFTTKGLGKGTGLGLATSYGAVTQMGGCIEVDSQVGQGSTFSIRLPRAVGAAVALPQANPASQMPGGTETILVAEDEERIRELVLVILRRLGYKVLAAADGQEALALAEAYPQPIHLLLTDVVMPKMNGQELARRFTPLHPESRILFTSGYAEDSIVHHGVVEAGLSFLAKPYLPQTLAKKVREVLDWQPAPTNS
jgi:two-component system cell cycle sensor histidine kinase/response regulator CckA